MDNDDLESAEPIQAAKMSTELVDQEKARRRAKKRNREEEENARIAAAAQGPRSAKTKGLENRVWMEAALKRQSPRSKYKTKDSKRAKLDEEVESVPKLKGKRVRVKEQDTKPQYTTTHLSSPSPLQRLSSAKAQAKNTSTTKTTAATQSKCKRSASPQSSQCTGTSAGSAEESSELSEPDETSDSSEGAEDEDDFDKELSDVGLAIQMAAEAPKVSRTDSSSIGSASGLFTVNEAEVTVIGHGQRSSSSQPRPPSSDSDSEDLPPVSSISQKWTEKKSKVAAKREAQFREERASSISAPPKPAKSAKRRCKLEEQDEEVPDAPMTGWPVHTKVHVGGLLRQNSYVQATCQKAIRIVERTLIVEDAWPELHRAAEYRVEVLTQAAKALEKGENGAEFRDIRKRIQKDNKYAESIGKWVIDRLAHACGPVRIDALGYIAIFQLGAGDDCVSRASTLLATDTYVYPGRWELDARGKPKWVVDGKKIYMNAAIISTLHSAFFSTPTALGSRHQEFYRSSHPEHKESELTISVVALAATGVHAALDAWKESNGNYIKKRMDKFDGERFKTVYKRHTKTLELLKAKNINAYHSIMSQIHSLVVGNQGQGSQVESGQADALAVIDLSEFDQ